MNDPNLAVEQQIFLYICKKPNLLVLSDPKYFKNPYVSKLCQLTKKFWGDYKIVPFNLQKPNIEQLRDYVSRHVNDVQVDRAKSKEDNVTAFVSQAELIITTDTSKYSVEYLDKAAKAWLMWKRHRSSQEDAIEYEAGIVITPENVLQVITESRKIALRDSRVSFDDDEGVDFFDPEAHIQLEASSFMDTGFKMLNTCLSNKPNGGFEPGTLNLFVGGPNIGKSIWLANLALNMMTSGYNVLVISLEMATYKIYRRMGSNAFRIPMNEYGEFANKRPTVEQKMNEFRNMNSQGGVMPVGTLRTRRYSRATAATIESFARDLEDKLGIKWHAVVIDYLNEMENAYGITSEKMYNFHKENTNDLYCMAGDNQWSVITAFQLKVAKMQEGDFSLGDLGESSGVTHRPDNIFGIIQSPDMKVHNEYLLKYLKARDSEYKEYKIPFTIDYKYMVLAEKGEQMIAPQAMSVF